MLIKLKRKFWSLCYFINEGDEYLVDDLKPDPLPIPSKRTPEYDPYMLIYKRKIQSYV